MPFIHRIFSPSTYHVLFYGILLGTQFFQSFVNGIVAFRTLARPHFSQLQQKIFPIYFALQSVLPLLVWYTSPGLRARRGTTWWDASAATSMTVVFLTGLLNLAVVGPWTTKVMRERKKQESKDGKKYYEEGEQSVEMVRLNKRFGMVHGVSSTLNLVAIGASVWYAGVLGERVYVL
jgi:hypothetical protein